MSPAAVIDMLCGPAVSGTELFWPVPIAGPVDTPSTRTFTLCVSAAGTVATIAVSVP